MSKTLKPCKIDIKTLLIPLKTISMIILNISNNSKEYNKMSNYNSKELNHSSMIDSSKKIKESTIFLIVSDKEVKLTLPN